MANFYVNFLTKEYNDNFSSYIIYDCACYEKYKNFKEVIFEKSGSYLCCLIIVIDGYTKEFHLKWPIMLGSLIDWKIRGNQNDQNLHGCFIIEGSVKLIYNFITNNLTNGHVYREKRNTPIFKVKIKADNKTINLVYDPLAQKKIQSKIYDEEYETNEKTKKRYTEIEKMQESEMRATIQESTSNTVCRNTVIEKDFKRQTKLFETTYKTNITNSVKGETWINFINSHSPFDVDYTEEDYIEYFDACLRDAPALDELANKTCITPNTILLKVLEIQILKVTKNQKCSKTPINARLTSMSNKLSTIIRNGNMFFALSNKIDYDAIIMTDYKSIYQTVEAQKLHLTAKLASTVKRSVNTCTINSSALYYPKDGMFFTCPIDTKDIKGAGENVSLAQLVITPKGIKMNILIEIFKSKRLQSMQQLDPNQADDVLLHVVINSYITPYFITKSSLIKLKKVCTIINFMVFGKFLVINTNGNVLMKYSIKYKFFVTPYEFLYLWPDAFEEYTDHLKYNPCSFYLSSDIDMAQSAKRNVANANVKGRCNIIESQINLDVFIHTIGASNSAIAYPIELNDKVITTTFTPGGSNPLKFAINLKKPHLRFLELGTSDVSIHPPMPTHLKKLFELYKPMDDKTEQNGMTWNNLISNADQTFKSIFKQLGKWYNPTMLITIAPKDYQTEEESFRKPLRQSILMALYNKNELDHDEPEKYDQSIFIKNIQAYIVDAESKIAEYEKDFAFDCNTTHSSHLFVNVAYGDYKGGTNEDGIVIDKKLYESKFRKLVSQTLNVRFSENVKVLKKNKVEENLLVYTPINTILGAVIFYGLLKSSVKLSVIKSKNIKIIECNVGETFRYLIVGEALSKYELTIESVFYPETKTVNIHFRYFVRLGIGLKISNLHGQKGIISTIADLSDIVAYRRDGTVIHPQILFSATSVVGRTTSSQLMSMYTQELVGFTSEGMVVAPQGINIHHIEPSNKSKVSLVKNDLMTSENGFLANELSFTSMLLKKQNSNIKSKHPMHLVQQLLALQGSSFNFLSFDPNAIKMIDTAEDATEDEENYDCDDEEDEEMDDINEDDSTDNKDNQEGQTMPDIKPPSIEPLIRKWEATSNHLNTIINDKIQDNIKMEPKKEDVKDIKLETTPDVKSPLKRCATDDEDSIKNIKKFKPI